LSLLAETTAAVLGNRTVRHSHVKDLVKTDVSTDITLNDAVGQLGALAEPTRLRIYRHLVRHAPDGLCVGDLLPEIGLSQPTLSFHLKTLLTARLVTRRKRGRRVFYAPEFRAMNELMQFLMENCCEGNVCLSVLQDCPAAAET